MDMTNVKKVYNFGEGYRVFALYNNSFESVTPYNQVILVSNNYNECKDFILANKKYHS